MRFLNDPEQGTVAVIGFGHVGACIAATLADRGFRVIGVDTDAHLVAELTGGRCPIQEYGLAEMVSRGMRSGSLRLTTDTAEAAAADTVLITVGTPVREDGSLADDQLQAACRKLGTHLRPGQLVVLKSTVPPGVTRNVVLPLLERGGLTAGVDFCLAFTPERLAEGTALHDLSVLPIVVGGLNENSTRDVATFWRHALGVQVIVVDSLEAAEVVKLASNWWIDLNIALANELAKYCASYGVDVLGVISAANTIPKGAGNVNILLPSVGVGGSCLTKDPWMVWHSAEQNGVQIRTAPVAREVNSGMPEYTAQLAIDELLRQGKNLANAKVAVLGLAFKNDTGDLRSTPTLGTVRMLAKAGAKVTLYDPLADKDAVEQMFRICPSDTLLEAVHEVDCIAVLALHRQFRAIDFAALPVAKSCVLLDGRAYYSKKKIAELHAAGYVYRGVGRGSAIGGPRVTERA